MRVVGLRSTLRGLAPLALFCTVLAAAACRTNQPVPEVELLLARPPIDVHTSSQAQIWEATRRFYEGRGMRLAWCSDAPTARAEAALGVLRSAIDHGLDPDDYGVDSLRGQREALIDDDDDGARRARLAEFDVRLTNALLSLGKDVSVGRSRSRAVHPDWRSTRQLPDLAASLSAASDKALDRWLESIQPRHSGYQELRAALAQLRRQASNGEWSTVPVDRLRPGSRGDGVRRLRERLEAGGELAPSPGGTVEVFDAAVDQAVRSFQYHHGLLASGRVDAATRKALNVPLAARARQVRLNLERWRWLPDDLGARHLRVNVPQFYLEGFEDGRRTLDIRVVVGRPGNETPLFSDEMTHVVFSPYWNIPESIVAGETVPALTEDDAYLARNNIEVVRIANDDAEAVDPADVDWTDEESRKDLRFRQRPGAGNALGLVKFLFPNRHSVYIHDTPADKLFSRLGRTFSHGCVRVEDPVALADWVLGSTGVWNRSEIRRAMHGGAERHVRLEPRIPVHLVYFTAWVDERGGLNFRSDVYGYDARQARLSEPPATTQRASR